MFSKKVYLLLTIGVLNLSLGISILHPLYGQTFPSNVNIQYESLISYFEKNLEEKNYNENLDRFKSLPFEDMYAQFSCYQKGKIFHKIGKTYYQLLDDVNAVRMYKDSLLKEWKFCESQTQQEEAQIYYNISMSLQYLNKIDEAIAYLNPALEIFEKIEDYDKTNLGKKYSGAGVLAKNANDFALSELYFSKALEIFKNNKDFRLADVYNHLGTLKRELGMLTEANLLFSIALQTHMQYVKEEKQSLLARIFHNLGTVNLDLKDYEKAEYFGLKELNLAIDMQDTFRMIGAKELLGVAKTEQGNFVDAENYLRDIIILSKDKMHLNELVIYVYRAYGNLADLYLKSNKYEDALRSINKAIQINVPNGTFDDIYNPIINSIISRDELDLLKVLALKAKILASYADEKSLKDALQTHEKIDTLFTNSLFGLHIEESQMDLLNNIKDHFGNAMIDHYGDAIQLSTQLYDVTGDEKYKEIAYHYSAKTKAIVLINNLKVSELRKNIHTPNLIEESDSLAKSSNELKIEYYNSDANAQDSIRGEILKVERAIENLDAKMKSEQPEFYKQQQTFSAPLSISKIQKKLDHNHLLIEFFITKNTLYSFWITAQDFNYYTLTFDKNMMNKFIEFRDACSQSDVWTLDEIKAKGYDLYVELFDIRIDEEKIDKITFIPDGIMHDIPFEALSYSSGEKDLQFLVEHFAISSSYSNQFLFEDELSTTNNYIGFGTSYSNALNKKVAETRASKDLLNLGSLRFAVSEIEHSAQIFNGKGFYNEQASKSNFLKAAGQADILHLSLHGLVDYDVPENSCIIFDDRTSDFVLRASEMYTQPINTNLVILSSCFSATGKIYRGEGVQGMSKAFLLAGSKTVISSLWEAAEVTSMKILPDFLKKVKKGVSKDIALHQAKKEYLESSRPSLQHPFYWANYIMIGNVSAPTTKIFQGKTKLIVISALAIILAISLVRLKFN